MNSIRITCKGSRLVALADLHILQKDLKDLSKENYEKLKNEILIEGYDEPISAWFDIVHCKWWILNGTQRKRTLTLMEAEGYFIPLLPISEIEAATIEEAKRKILGLASQYGNMTSQGLYEFMADAAIPFDEMDKRFRFPEINNKDFEEEFYSDPKSSEGEDDVPERRTTTIKLGDLFQLGKHRLLCGDSTDAENVTRLMNGEKADMVYTDPPYGMKLDTDYDDMYAFGDHTHTGNRFKKVEGDDTEYDPAPILNFKCPLFVWGVDYFYDKLPKGGSFIAWDKRTETLDKVPGNTTEFCWAYPPVRRTTARILWSGHFGMNGDDAGVRIHPTQKPIKLHEWFFERWGKDKTNIVDLYLGSGSTLIACEKTNRKCFGLEIDPQYCQVIIDRFIKFVGSDKDVFKINTDGSVISWVEFNGA